jgi:hypothetical protein
MIVACLRRLIAWSTASDRVTERIGTDEFIAQGYVETDAKQANLAAQKGIRGPKLFA